MQVFAIFELACVITLLWVIGNVCHYFVTRKGNGGFWALSELFKKWENEKKDGKQND
jgi:hypothetical protein